MTEKNDEPGARANEGFGAPGSRGEQRRGADENPPAPKEASMETKPGKDGLDPQSLEKAVKSEEEMIAEQQLDEDIAVTGAPAKDERPQQPQD